METETQPVEQDPPEDAPDVEKEAFLERLNKESLKRKEAEKTSAQQAKEVRALKAQLEEREQAGLPELEQMKKQLEKAEKRADEAERRAEEGARQAERATRAGWVAAAAQSLKFIDPEDASLNVDLDTIEDRADAERAVKRVAKAKPHLVKADDPALPGQRLKDGQRINLAPQDDVALEEGQRLLDGINALRSGMTPAGPA